MKLINNPHDKFFKHIFNNKENIITLLKFIFQKNNINFIDFNNIKIISNEQNNKKFKDYFDVDNDIRKYLINYFEDNGL